MLKSVYVAVLAGRGWTVTHRVDDIRVRSVLEEQAQNGWLLPIDGGAKRGLAARPALSVELIWVKSLFEHLTHGRLVALLDGLHTRNQAIVNVTFRAI